MTKLATSQMATPENQWLRREKDRPAASGAARWSTWTSTSGAGN